MMSLAAISIKGKGRYACRIGAGEMEMGLGIHGEPGAYKAPLQPVDAIVSKVGDSWLNEAGCPLFWPSYLPQNP